MPYTCQKPSTPSCYYSATWIQHIRTHLYTRHTHAYQDAARPLVSPPKRKIDTNKKTVDIFTYYELYNKQGPSHGDWSVAETATRYYWSSSITTSASQKHLVGLHAADDFSQFFLTLPPPIYFHQNLSVRVTGLTLQYYVSI